MGRAARKGSTRTMTFLSDHTSAPLKEAIVVEALMSRHLEKVQLVLGRATDLPVTRKLVHTAARYSCLESLALIWERACRAEMTEDVTRNLAEAAMLNGVWPENLRFLLDKVEDLVVGPEALVNV